MSNGDIIIPPTDLTTATIDAVNLILSQLGLSPLDQIISLFSGKPKFDDTEAVIAAYQQSAYWPLHALASDMQIWVKNGAPISDSNPAVQASFGVAKQGTVESIQQLAGEQPGQSSPGYWTIFALIQGSWGASGYGEQEVLKYVKALDALTQVLSQQNTKPPPPPPPIPPPVPPPPGGGGLNGDLIQELIACLCDETSDECCTAVVAAIAKVAQQLAVIASALTFGGKGGGGGGQTIDLGPITAALQALVTAVTAYPPALEACCNAIVGSLGNIATAIDNATGVDTSGIVTQLKRATDTDILPTAFVDELVKMKVIPPALAQQFSEHRTSWSITSALAAITNFLLGAPNIKEVKDAAATTEEIAKGAVTSTFETDNLATAALQSLVIVGVIIGNVFKAVLPALNTIGADISTAIGTAIQTALPGAFDGRPITVGSPAEWALEYVQLGTVPDMLITPDNYSAVVNDAFARAAKMGFSAWILAMLGGLLMGPFEKSFGIMAALVSTAAGFDEIAAQQLKPYFRAVIGRPATQQSNRDYPTAVPAGPAGLALWARRKISDGNADQLLGYAGMARAWRPAMHEGAYRPLQPRVVVNAFLDQPIDRATLVALLEDAALSPANVQTMADAIIYKSIANVRNSYLSALVTGYGKGVISDQELSDALTQFNFSAEAKQYVTAHVLILRREVLAAEAEKTVVPLVANGNISADEGLQQLEAAGVQPWYSELQITLATTRATIHAAKLEAAAERKAELARQRNLTRAAVAEFQSGAIDEAALTATLIALGLDASLVASIVAVQTAMRQGRLRLVYGQLLSPSDAKLLTEKVAAIAQQTKDQLITLDQARAQIAALNVDQAEAEALVARWAATLKKSSGAAVLLPP